MIIACVYKTGGEYTFDHVRALYDNVLSVWDFGKDKINKPRFYCLTDDESVISIPTKPLTHNLFGWWSKLELFKPGQFNEKVLYLDLDTKLFGSPRFLFDTEDFTMLRDFYHLNKYAQSSVMVFKPEHAAILWDRFQYDLENGKHFTKKKVMPYWRGDQMFIERSISSIGFIQDKWPGKVVSYKVHCRGKDGTDRLPEGAAVVCWHGKPRPWETPLWEREI